MNKRKRKKWRENFVILYPHNEKSAVCKRTETWIIDEILNFRNEKKKANLQVVEMNKFVPRLFLFDSLHKIKI